MNEYEIFNSYYIVAAIGRDTVFSTLRPRQNGRQFADNLFQYIFLDENVWISIKISLKLFSGSHW